MRGSVVIVVALLGGCASSAERRAPGSLECPAGTTHVGGRPRFDTEQCVEAGTQRQHGPARIYFPNSSVIGNESVWEHGVQQGSSISRWENGRVMERGQYLAGKHVGAWKRWSQTGELDYERAYDDQGELHGLAISWSSSGSVEVRCFEHGRELWLTRDAAAINSARCPGPRP